MVRDEDERFAKRFTDEAFREGARRDPRGRIREEDCEVSSESSDSESEDIEINDAVWEAPDHHAPRGDDSSRRLAFMGLDWNSIGAEDILSVCRSSARKADDISKVMIFPSETGKEMLDKEAMEGPQFQETVEDEENPEEAIRKYNSERSKYYYGVVFCETTEAAEVIYNELDGIGVPALCAGRPLDVRFIPDDLEFPYAHVSEATQVSRTYEAQNEESHTRGGLAHSKALCHWDEANPKRKKDLMKKMSKLDMEANDLAVYLASDSDSDECKAAKDLDAFLAPDSASDECKAKDFDAFQAPDSDSDDCEAAKDLDLAPDSASGAAAKVSRTDEADNEEEHSKADIAELELLTHGETTNDRNFNLKKRKKKKKRSAEEVDASGFKENLLDDRLQKMYEDPNFALDPTHPSFKKSQTMDKFLEKTRQRKKRKVKTTEAPRQVATSVVEETVPDMRIFG